MRIFTEKDRKGLVAALRRFVKAMSGERLGAEEGGAIIDKALATGLTVDELLNRENWGRALALSPELGASEYIDMMCDRRIEVRPLKAEPDWHNPEIGGFRTVAEAIHDFYYEVTGKGGKWNVPSGLSNLALAIDRYSVQALVSEALAEAVGGDSPVSFFDYIRRIVKHFRELPVDDSLTEEQQMRVAEEAGMLCEGLDPGDGGSEDDDNPPAPTYVEPEDGIYPSPENYETSYLLPNPMDMKRTSVGGALFACTPEEIASLVKCLRTESGEEPSDEGTGLSLSEIVDLLTDGRFDPSGEDPVARQVHMQLNGDLTPSFIECVTAQAIDMDEETASRYDILHDSWDLRNPKVRRLGKLKNLIFRFGEEDQDLFDALSDLEAAYNE